MKRTILLIFMLLLASIYISPVYAEDLFQIIIENGNAYVNDQIITEASPGQEVYIECEQIEGKQFIGWHCEQDISFDQSSESFTLIMPSENISITATYANVYSIEIEGGTCDHAAAIPGESITIQATPSKEQIFDHWEGIDATDIKQEQYVFSMPESNLSIKAVYHNDQWISDAGGMFYQHADGSYPSSSFESIPSFDTGEEKKYYFDTTGHVKTGWVYDHSHWYYMDQTGAMTTGWQYIKNKWYYMNTDGIMQTGWIKLKNTWYYLNSSGVMLTGWQKINNVWYYFNPSGSMRTGWLNEGNKWYYLKSSGAMATGWAKDNNKWYYMNSSGVMQTGWLQSGNAKYYLKASGAMATNWEKIYSKWYLFSNSGAMLKGWQKVNNIWYYLDSNGVMQTGWKKLGNIWYYLDGSGAMAVKWKKIGSSWYYFNTSGAMQTGWIKPSSKWYYLASSGVMKTNWITLKNVTYYLGSDGSMRTGWQDIDDYTYHFDNSGALNKGWKTIDNDRYFFDTSTGIMAKGIRYTSGTWNRFDDTGKWIKEIHDAPDLSSRYAVAYDASTGDTLFDKNADQKMWPASMTKMMTMILAIENTKDLNQKVTVTEQMIRDLDGTGLTTAGYQEGDTPTVKDLLYAACLPSGADATNILAYKVAGSPSAFVKLMNKKAAELGMTNTHFANNHGNDSPNNYSTCRDIAKLLAYASKNATFKKVISTIRYTTSPMQAFPYGQNLRSIVLIYCKGYEGRYNFEIPGLIGGKSGYTPDAGYTLAITTEVNGKKIVYVTAKSFIQQYYPSHVEDISNIALYLNQ